MITLYHIAESLEPDNAPYYNFGKVFASFKVTLKNTFQANKKQYESELNRKLKGKTIQANASKGYKQVIKKYEFTVGSISIENYYGNYVVIVKDTSTPKPKEYFLTPGYKVKIIASSNVASDNTAISSKHNNKESDNSNNNNRDTNIKEEVTDEDNHTRYESYSKDAIYNDIKTWLPKLLKNKSFNIKDVIKKIGWLKEYNGGISIAVYELLIPVNNLVSNISIDLINTVLQQASKKTSNIHAEYEMTKSELNSDKTEWTIHIKKRMSYHTNE